MGYCIEQDTTEFRIKKTNFKKALSSVKSLAARGKLGWVSAEDYENARTLPEAMEGWRWEAKVDEESGDVIDVVFVGEKLGEDKLFFDALAPYVEAGSFIEMVGEDHSRWRWVFDGSTCATKYATVSW